MQDSEDVQDNEDVHDEEGVQDDEVCGGGATHMRTSVYYNEHDPAACGWLRELMKKGMIPEGEIDERSIVDVQADDLGGYAQCHFFAGIGGWAYALRLAGVPDLECWTGSAPCQPFSAAGKKRGTDDERHLWPELFRLIRVCRPELVVGEQVKAAIGHGWLDLVSSELEMEDYAVASAVLGAHSVGAPHLRQRVYWGGILGDAVREGRQPSSVAKGGARGHGLAERPGEAGVLGHRDDVRQLQGEGRHEPQPRAGELAPGEPSEAGFWDGCERLPCDDGKARPIEPGTLPLAHGVPRRVELLKGYGNAVVPQVAAEFVKALIG
ncbi:MAG: DNA cytosine methyltransferase [Candidatus Sulfotelmatobacter sp.]